jgi:transposase-like protein
LEINRSIIFLKAKDYLEKALNHTNYMKTKICTLCKQENRVMYRIKIAKGKLWIFVCESCCKSSQNLPDYSYGGTWKG